MQNIKEVRFDLYCQNCREFETPETKDPCNDCLAKGWNIDSHKPIYYKEKDKSGQISSSKRKV